MLVRQFNAVQNNGLKFYGSIAHLEIRRHNRVQLIDEALVRVL